MFVGVFVFNNLDFSVKMCYTIFRKLSGGFSMTTLKEILPELEEQANKAGYIVDIKTFKNSNVREITFKSGVNKGYVMPSISLSETANQLSTGEEICFFDVHVHLPNYIYTGQHPFDYTYCEDLFKHWYMGLGRFITYLKTLRIAYPWWEEFEND